MLIFVNVIAGAGNETTNRLIGWIGRVLSDYPEQRREIAANRALIPAAIEEILASTRRATRSRDTSRVTSISTARP